MDLSAFARRSLALARASFATPYTVSALLGAVLAWQLAGLTWIAVPAAPAAARAPTDPPPEVRPAAEGPPPATQLARLHLFGRPPPPEPAPAQDVPSAPETKLDLALKGIYAAGGGTGIAVIVAGDGAEKVYAVGDTIAGSARITGIFPGRVMLRRGGQPETLHIDRGDALIGGPATRSPAGSPRSG